MFTDQRLLAEIEDQLSGDILHFAWLVQLIRHHNPAILESECSETVVDLVTYLHQQGKIVVGNARETDGIVLIDPWLESNDALRDRLTTEIGKSKDRDFCFWIQSVEQNAR